VGGTLNVGANGALNQLIIENGGTITNGGSGSIGVGSSPGYMSSNNLMVVTGSGSSFTQLGSDFGLGGAGSNRLVVTDGATFRSTNIRMSGPNNAVAVTNGGYLRTLGISVGETAAANSNLFLLSGAASSVTNAGSTTVGGSGAYATLRIENGAKYTNAVSTVIGQGAGSSNNLMVLSGTGSVYKNGNDFSLGGGSSNTLLITSGGFVASPNFQFTGQNNQIILTNGGTANTVATLIGVGSATANNRVVVTGTGSVLNASYTGYSLIVGYGGASKSLLQIGDGGAVNAAGPIFIGGFFGSTSQSNTILVTGLGSQLNVTGSLYFAYGDLAGTPSIGNQITVADSAQLTVLGATYLGLGSGGANSNIVTITGAGSVFNNTANDFLPNYVGVGNQLVITNGGKVASLNGRIGTGGGSQGLGLVTGSGSVWTNISGVYAGENGNDNTLRVEDGAQLYTTELKAGHGTGSGNSIRINSGGLAEMTNLIATALAGNTISNVGGVYQFFSGTPTVTPNGAGRIALTGGTISYRSVTNADIAFAGNNTFRLNSASNSLAGQTYTFTDTLGPTNYTRLEMINGETAYRGGNLTIGSGGSMLISNTRATISGLLTNLGSFISVNAQATFSGAVYNNGTWATDPTTNTFASTHTVGTLGSITMTPGDLMIFQSFSSTPAPSPTPTTRSLANSCSTARAPSASSPPARNWAWRRPPPPRRSSCRATPPGSPTTSPSAPLRSPTSAPCASATPSSPAAPRPMTVCAPRSTSTNC